MTISATDVATLHDYAAGVMQRGGHHAGQVTGIFLTLLGAVTWRADAGSIEIKQYDGRLANVAWFAVRGHYYAFAYNHHTGLIELRDRTMNGPALYTFDNTTPVTDVETIFRNL